MRILKIIIPCLCLLLAGYFLWQPLTHTFIKYCLTTYCKKGIGAELTSSDMQQVDGKWVITQPVLMHPAKGIHGQADQAIVSYAFNGLSIHFDLQLINPTIEFKELPQSAPLALETEQKGSALLPFTLFDFSTDLHIDKGLVIHDGHQTHISLDAFLGQDVKFQGKLWDVNEPDHTFQFQLNTKEKSFFLLMNELEVTRAAVLLPLWQDLPIQFSKGRVNGWVKQESNQQPSGDVFFHDLQIAIPVLQITANLPKAQLQIQNGESRWTFIEPATSRMHHPSHLALDSVRGECVIRPEGPSEVNIDALCQVQQQSFPIHASASFKEIGFVDFEIKSLHHQDQNSIQGVCGVLFNKCWVQLNKLPLQTYLAPLIGMENLDISGDADIQGILDSSELFLYFDLHDLSIDHPNFLITSDSLQKGGTYTLDLSTHHYEGSLPLSQLSYKNKQHEIALTGINAKCHFTEQLLSLKELEGFCQGIYFAGEYSSQSPLHGGQLHLHTLNGNTEQFSSLPFLAHLKFPIDGNIALRQNGADITFAYDPEKTDLEMRLEGSFADGKLKQKSPQLSVQDLSFNFDYNSSNQHVTLTELQGAVFVGSTKYSDEYILSSDRSEFTLSWPFTAHFDFWVGDRNRDILRLAGTASPTADNNETEVALDHHLSHFGDVHPEHFLLRLKKGMQAQLFDLKLNLQLKTLFKDLQKFSRTGLLFPSGHLLKELNKLSTAEGNFHVHLSYNALDDFVHYNIDAKDFTCGKYHFAHCLFRGKNRGKQWSIDQLQLDKYSFSAEAQQQDDAWSFPFLGFGYGKAFLMGMEGKYLPSKNSFVGKVNLLESQLEHIGEWPALQRFANQFRPTGALRSQGEITIEWLPDSSYWDVIAHLTTKLQNWSIQGIAMADVAQCELFLTPGKAIEVQHLSLQPKQMPSIFLHLGQCLYDYSQHDTQIKNSTFRISTEYLPTIIQQLKDFAIQGNALEWLSKTIKGSFTGSFQLHASPNHHELDLTLEKGKYLFNSTPIQLETSRITSNPFDVQLSTQYHLQDKLIPLTIKSQPHFETGEIKSDECIALWATDPTKNLYLKKVEGKWLGITINLQPTPDTNVLHGHAYIDLESAMACLPLPIQTLCQKWKISGNYVLNGDWSLINEPPYMTFHGDLKGHPVKIQDSQFSYGTAHLEFDARKTKIDKLQLQDSTGMVEIPYAEYYQNQIHIPSALLTQFYPSIIPGFKIRQLSLIDLKGNLSNTDTVTGKGILIGEYTPAQPSEPDSSKELSNEEFASFFPKSGTAHFQIEKGKIILTKLEDVYSVGKIIHFQLPKQPIKPSFIDFNGNLSMQIRLKQNGLFQKLAEPYLLMIEGTLQNPKFQVKKTQNSG